MVTTEQQAPGSATVARDGNRLRRMALTGPGTGRG
jgi:hypothetical protein